MKRSLQLFKKQNLAIQRMKNLLNDGFSSPEEELVVAAPNPKKATKVKE